MPEHSVKVYEYLKAEGVPAQAYFHQGGHGGAPPLELMNRWFTRYLYGVENGVENDPKAWIVREGDERGNPTPYPDYPNPDASPVTLSSAGGRCPRWVTWASAPTQGRAPRPSWTTSPSAALSWPGPSGRTIDCLYATRRAGGNPSTSPARPRSPFVWHRANPPRTYRSGWCPCPGREGQAPTGGVITRGWADPQNHRSLTQERAPGTGSVL